MSNTPDPNVITALIAERDDLRLRLERLTADLAVLNRHITEAEAAIENVAIRARYRYTLDTLRGRIVGTLTGRMDRMLATALAAAQAEPPRAPVIIERIEDVIAMLAAFVEQEGNRETSSPEAAHAV